MCPQVVETEVCYAVRHEYAQTADQEILASLPTPIFHERTYPMIQRLPIPSDEPGDVSTITYIRETILPEPPRCPYILLSHVLRELYSTHNLLWAESYFMFRTGS